MMSPHCFAIVEKASEVQSSSGRPKIPSQVARSLMWRSFVHGLRDLNKVRRVVLIRAFAVEVVSGKFRRSVSPPRWVLGVLFLVGEDSGIGGSRELTPNLRSLGELRVVLGVVFVTFIFPWEAGKVPIPSHSSSKNSNSVAFSDSSLNIRRCNIRILSNLCNDSCSVSNEAENTINVGNKIGFNMDGKKNKVTSILANGEHAVDQ
ncbi:hypothetical protein Tco_1252133 [Tanacetum coccineum]